MHTKVFFLSLIALTGHAKALSPTEELELKIKYMVPFAKAFADYGLKFSSCNNEERDKPPLNISDLAFLNQKQAQILLLKEHRHRISTCARTQEDIVIRKHVETLALLRDKDILPADQEILVQTIDFYPGLEREADERLNNEAGLIPPMLRERFYRVVKDKSLDVNVFDITESLPE